jgi:hypothetical protein
LEHKPDKGFQAGLRGIAEAKRLNLPYEEGIAHYHIGRFLPSNQPLRHQHLKQAAAIFEKLGAMWDLEQSLTALDT